MSKNIDDKGKPDKPVNSEDLPQKGIFKKKEVYQHPQPADWGKAIDPDNVNGQTQSGKEQNKTGKSEGINEERSEGSAGAFEGFEDQNEKAP